jgi:hypothetical protein
MRQSHAHDPLANPDLHQTRLLVRWSRARDLPDVLPRRRPLMDDSVVPADNRHTFPDNNLGHTAPGGPADESNESGTP